MLPGVSPFRSTRRFAAALLLLALPAPAIVYRDDETDATALGLANQPQFSGVGLLQNGNRTETGTATAISANWVLTAKHVVSGFTTATFYAANGQTITGTVYADPNSDVALIKLDTPLNVSGFTPVAFIPPNVTRNVNWAGNQIWNVGYGNYGTYSSSANGTLNGLDGKRRAGTNFVDSSDGSSVIFSNQNTGGTEFESSTAPGDSGGPMFLQKGYQWQIIGEVLGAGGQGFVDTDVSVDNFIATTTGLTFTKPAAPTSLKWNATYLSPSTAASRNITSKTDGAGVWDTSRLNFTDDTYTYAWENGTLLPVTFGLGTGAAGTVTLGADISISDLTFSAAGSGTYTIAGSGTFGLTLRSTGSTITANVAATISAAMDGAGALTKAGVGTLTVAGANTYTGGTILQAGTLALTGSGTLGNAAGALSIAAGATLNLGGTSPAAGNFSGAGTVTNSSSGTTSTLTIGSGNTGGGSYTGAIQNGAGVTAVTKTGTAALTLAGTDSYTGATTLLGGTLIVGSAAALPAATTLTFNGASTLDLGGNSAGVVALTLGSTTTASLYTVKNGSLTLSGAADFLLNPLGSSGTTVVDLSGAGAFTYNHAANAFGIGGAGSTGIATTLQLAAVNNLTAASLTVGGQAATAATPAGTLHLGTTNTINTGAIQLGGYRVGTTLLDFASGLTNPTVKLRGTGGGVTAVGAIVVGQNNNGSAQSGSLDLSAGSTDAIVSTLVVGAAATNGAATGSVHLAGGVFNAGTIELGYSFSTNGSANTTTGSFTQDAGTVLAGSVVFGTRIGTLGTGTQVNDSLQTTYTLGTAATAALLSAQTLSLGTTVESAASRATLAFTNGTVANYDPALGQSGSAGAAGGPSTAQDLTLSGTTGGGAAANKATLTLNLLDGPGVTHTFSAGAGRAITVASTALITGSGALTKSGPGTLTLQGADTHTGATTVTAGALYVSGSINGTASLGVSGGGTLGGNGTITTPGGSVTMAAGAKLSPGLGGAGQFTFTLGAGLLDLSAEIAGSGTAALLFDLGTVSDLVKLNSGTLKLGAAGLGLDDFAFATGSGFGPGSYTLFNTSVPFDGSLDPSHLSGTVGGLPASLSLDATTEKVMLVVVPEPGAGLLGILGGAGFLLRPQRRRKGKLSAP